MTDLPPLTKIHQTFENWKENPPNEFYEEIDEECSRLLAEFEKKPGAIFQPTKEKALNDLRNMQFSQLAKIRLNRFIGNCDTALGYLAIEKAQFINGTRKEKLTAWWLSKIDVATRGFLDEKHYDDKAIPVDYISEPPADLEPIKKNLSIIENILHPVDGNQDARNLADTLKVVIYEKINNFIDNVGVLLGDMLDFDPETFSVDVANAALQKKKDSMESSLFSCIGDMIKDVDYLLEMQEMENPEKNHNSGGGLVLSNVVPISGLIMSTFFRRENVLRTILELYDYCSAPSAPLSNGPTPVENNTPENGPSAANSISEHSEEKDDDDTLSDEITDEIQKEETNEEEQKVLSNNKKDNEDDENISSSSTSEIICELESKNSSTVIFSFITPEDEDDIELASSGNIFIPIESTEHKIIFPNADGQVNVDIKPKPIIEKSEEEDKSTEELKESQIEKEKPKESTFLSPNNDSHRKAWRLSDSSGPIKSNRPRIGTSRCMVNPLNPPKEST